METTKRQKEILAFVKKYIVRNLGAPTFREIGKQFKISPKGAYDHLKALERQGLILMSGKKTSRGLKIPGLKMVSLKDVEMYLDQLISENGMEHAFLITKIKSQISIKFGNA